MTIEIKPKIGLNDLRFGATMKEVQDFFGKPQETERIDDLEDYKSSVWHYWDLGFSAFFDDSTDGKFTCVEIDNEEAMLWEKQIFLLPEKEIISLFKIKGYKEIDIEQQTWGERRISFDDAVVDLYFDDQKLISINFSMGTNENKVFFFPN